jgi:hypothetical protein
VTGEPLTPARAAVLERAGAVARPTYATTEAGALGEGCLLPSSLRPLGPFVFLNVALGDQAEVSHRSCGCPHERQGYGADPGPRRDAPAPLRRRAGPRPARRGDDERDADLRLLGHPAVGDVDERLVVDACLEAIGSGVGGRERPRGCGETATTSGSCAGRR